MIDYLFYKIHRAYYKAQGQRDGAIMTMFTIGFLLYLNLFTFGALLRKLDIIPTFLSTKAESIAFGICLIILCYFLFIRKRRYIEIEARFEGETKSEKIKGGITVILYVLLTFIVGIAVAFYRKGVI